jgi:hypothetical protein
VSEPRRTAHDGHDLELVARAAAGDIDAREAEAARLAIAGCGACAALEADLRAIAAATRDLGAPGEATSIRAPRDFRLSAADAARLRRHGALGLARPSAWVGGRARGLGGALATLGLVGLLVSTGLPGFSGGAASPSAGQELGGTRQKDNASPVPALGPLASDAYTLVASDDPARIVDPSRDQLAPPITSSAAIAAASMAILVLGLVLLVTGRLWRRAGS